MTRKKREWLIWDGKGWSASLLEYANASTLFGIEGSILWGLFDLGSPKFPGAGTGPLWFPPDKLFGVDMSPYYTLHDWLYGPGADLIANLKVEWKAFLAGRKEGVPLLLQIIYSLATTAASISEWWEAVQECLNEKLGYGKNNSKNP